MAISVNKQPSKYSPSNNPLFLSVESSNNNIIYFNTSIKSSGTTVSNLKMYVTPNAPNTGSIDLSNVLFNYTSTPIANTTAFVTSFNTGYLNYNIELIEMVNSSGNLVSGATTTINDLNVYNGYLNTFDFEYYGYRNYYINPVTTAKFLSTKPSINKVNPWSKEFLYFLADGYSTLAKAVVKTYTATGSTTYDEVVSVGANKLHRLNISPKHLKTSLNIDFDGVVRYEVYLIDSSNQALTEIKTFQCINLPCNNEPANLLWINNVGGLDSFTFINPKETKSIKRSSFKTNRYKDFSIASIGVINQIEKTYNVSQTSEYTLTTPILNDWEFVYLTDMLSSEQVFVELTDGTLYPIVLKTTSAEVKRKKYSTTVPRLTITYEAESNLNIVPDSYLSFSAGLSQIGFNVPTVLSTPSGYYEILIGDNSNVYFIVNHNLQSTNVAVDLVLVSNGQTIFGDVVRINSNTISVEFGEVISTNSVKVMVSKLD